VRRLIIGGAVAALSLSACARPAGDGSVGSPRHGRYVGVGIYPAGQMWSQVVASNAPKDAAASRSSDDEQIIVVVDSATGELRQCGNLTGYCVGMNPWAKPLASSQVAPVPLVKHADQLAREAATVAKQEVARPTNP
jgi:hypothetical protein